MPARSSDLTPGCRLLQKSAYPSVHLIAERAEVTESIHLRGRGRSPSVLNGVGRQISSVSLVNHHCNSAQQPHWDIERAYNALQTVSHSWLKKVMYMLSINKWGIHLVHILKVDNNFQGQVLPSPWPPKPCVKLDRIPPALICTFLFMFPPKNLKT